jgi:hypothetical protein
MREEEGDQLNSWQQQEEEEEETGQKKKKKNKLSGAFPTKKRKMATRLSIEDVIQASNLYELCEKKGIAQEKLSANDYYQYVRARKLLEKHNEIPLQYIGTSSGKIDQPFEYLPYFEWQSFLLERMISKRPLEDKRKIIFLVDPIGNNGKSVFFQWLSSLPAGTINKYLPTTAKPESEASVVSGSTNKIPLRVNDSRSAILSSSMMENIKEEEDNGLLHPQPDIIRDSGAADADENNVEGPLKDTEENNLSHPQNEIMSPISRKQKEDSSDSMSMMSMMSMMRDPQKTMNHAIRENSTILNPSMNNNIEFQYLTVDGNGKGSSSANDILYLVDCSQANLSTTQSIFLVDLARCESLNYALLEKLKNGAWMSTKYEGKKASYKNGQVIVAMNELPDVTKLSQDRYEIYLIHNKKFAFEGKPIPVAKIPTLKKMHPKFLQYLLTLV